MHEAELLRLDGEARQQALDVSRSFIVQAPAGSGKTELLIQRYLCLLAIVDDPEEVLAITFTRKAAAEMRERVVAALKRAESGKPPEKPHERITGDAATRVLERDRQRQWELLASPRRMRIQTLDALCAGISRLRPVTSGLGVGGAVVQDAAAKTLYRQAALATLDWLVGDDRLANAVETVHTHLDDNTGLYVDYLGRMLQSRDQWLGITGSGEPSDPDAVRRRLESNLADIVRHQLDRVRDRLAGMVGDDFFGLCRYAAANLVADGRSDPATRDLQTIEQLPAANADRLPHWQTLVSLLQTASGQWRRKLTKAQGFPPRDDGEKDAWMTIIGDFSAHRELREQLHALTRLPPAAYSDSQWHVLLALFRVLPLAVTELKRLFAAQGATDHVEIAEAAGAALGSADAPGDVAMMLDYRISHLLVDEMQDTSISQYRLLETLTAGWQPGDGRSFFCVGDPMQSIYRFRNAEVGQFVRASSQGLGTLALEALVLRRNFRSGQRLVHWFNAVFADLFPARDDPATGAVGYSESVPVDALHGLGEHRVHALFDADAGLEAERTCDVVQARLAESAAAGLGVLVRSRTQLPELLSAFRQRGVRYRAVEIDRLTDLPEITDLLALTRSLCHHADRAAWLGLLRGPLVGLDWTDLHRLVSGAPGEPVWALLQDEDRLGSLSAVARELLAGFRPAMLRGMQSRRARGLRDRVERCWFELGGPACLASSDQVDNAYRFLAAIEAAELAGTLPDPALIREILDGERVSSPPDDDCRVEVMTMHKAKGLQFDHVVLPSLGRYTGVSRRPVLSWLNLPADDGGSDLILSPVGPSHELERDLLHGFIEASRRHSDRLEQDRLLYVACTRAKRSLDLIAGVAVREDGEGVKDPDPRSLLSRLWPAVVGDVRRQFEAHDARPAAAGGDDDVFAMPVLARKKPGWRMPEAPRLPASPTPADEPETPDAGSVVPYDWVGANARAAGTIVHRWLLRMATGRHGRDPAALEATRALTERWARAMGVADADLGAVAERVAAALAGILSDPRGEWLLSGDGASELPLTGVWRGRIVSVVIDRVRIDAGVHWIVDYKTSSHEGGDTAGFLAQEADRYRPQLSRYESLYRAYSGVSSTRTALYFPLLQAFREVGSGAADDIKAGLRSETDAGRVRSRNPET